MYILCGIVQNTVKNIGKKNMKNVIICEII